VMSFKLSLVYEALAAGNYKNAAKLALNAEGRRKGGICAAARALRCLALVRLEKGREAEELMHGLRQGVREGKIVLDMDDLHKMQMYYREVQREEEAAKLFEEYWTAGSYSDELLGRCAFMSFFRSKQYMEAQRVATRLSRSFSGSKEFTASPGDYSLWCALASYMQVWSNQVDDRFLAIAIGLAKKAISLGSKGPEVARFVQRITEATNKEDYRAMIEEGGPLYSHFSSEAERLEAILDSEESREARIDVAERLIEFHDHDSWTYWERFIDEIIGDDTQGNTDEDADRSRILRLIESVQKDEKTSSLKVKRASFLARVELESRIGNPNSEEFLGLILNYFERFGDRPICSSDLRSYIERISAPQMRRQLSSNLLHAASLHPEQWDFHVTARFLTYWMGVDIPESPSELFSRFLERADPRSGSMSLNPSDNYVLLTCARLLQIQKSVEDPSDHLRLTCGAIVALEIGLRYSGSNFHMRLLLIELYLTIGAGWCALEHWRVLDVKHIQWVTLSHHVYLPFFQLACWEGHKMISAGILEISQENLREGDESVQRAIEKGSFNTAIEITSFQQRLERSWILALHSVFSRYVTLFDSWEPRRAARKLNTGTGCNAKWKDHELISNEDHETLGFLLMNSPRHQGHLAVPIEEISLLSCQELILDLFLHFQGSQSLTEVNKAISQAKRTLEGINRDSHWIPNYLPAFFDFLILILEVTNIAENILLENPLSDDQQFHLEWNSAISFLGDEVTNLENLSKSTRFEWLKEFVDFTLFVLYFGSFLCSEVSRRITSTKWRQVKSKLPAELSFLVKGIESWIPNLHEALLSASKRIKHISSIPIQTREFSLVLEDMPIKIPEFLPSAAFGDPEVSDSREACDLFLGGLVKRISESQELTLWRVGKGVDQAQKCLGTADRTDAFRKRSH